MQPKKVQNRLARKRRIRARVTGDATKPSLSVFRSLRTMSAQLIDDAAGTTLAEANTKALKAKPNKEGAKKLGEAIAKKAKDAKIESIVFDRNGYAYHGAVNEFADAAREGGLVF